MEHLLTAAVKTLSKPLSSSTFTPEILIVQSKGMQRWLSMEFAKHFGVWANAKYPFPNRFVTDICDSIIPSLSQGKGFTPKVMRWKIAELLPGLLHLPQFDEIRGYLSTGSYETKLYQLSDKIADLFDQYTLYRGEMITKWCKGRGEGWQPLLWRAVVKETPGIHSQELQKQLVTALDDGDFNSGLLPERVTVFGISSLPRFHMDILAAISRITEVNLFVLSPCELYWGDILPGKASSGQQNEFVNEVEQWNPLLASMGRLGKDFSNLILDYEHLHGGGSDLYTPATGGSVLATIQNDLLLLRSGSDDQTTSSFSDDDNSISIHSCHSPLREVEVLHDNILQMFETLPGLKPGDILVMTPDIEAYTPFISAVFDSDPGEITRIPYAIADRSILSGNCCADALLSILALPGSRFEAPAIMDILNIEPVSTRFGMGKNEIETIRSWIEETRIRWGMDGAGRVRFGVPGYDDQTWQSGMDRLLLGVAMPEDDGSLFAGVLPYDAMEGEKIIIAGKFATFIEQLHETVISLEASRNIPEWVATLKEIVHGFFSEDDDSGDQLQPLYELFDELSEQCGLSGFKGELTLTTIVSWLSENLSARQRGVGFMTGGVTFCAMLPMRSIPFRVIAVIGMNDGDFPRQKRPAGFDLMAASPMPGDRSLRNEDRYLFLEALLSARDRLYISYVGQGIRDNSSIPPSVLVSELMDYLGNRCNLDEEGVIARFHTKHKLQPFSPDYFTPGKQLFSYSKEGYNALQSLKNRVGNIPEFLPIPLPDPPEEMLEINLDSLFAFYRNPCRFLLVNRLGIRPDETPAQLEKRETFSISHLDRYLLKDEIIRCAIDNRPPEELLPIARAKGLLPPAAQGDRAFRKAIDDIQPLVTRINDARSSGNQLTPLVVDVTVGRFRLKGSLDNIRTDNLLRYRPAAFNGQDAIRLWIEHLLLNHVLPCSYPSTSVMLSEDLTIRLDTVQNPVEILHELLETYWRGLCQPLHFFPKSSFSFAKTGSIEKAASIWEGEDYPEGSDPYYRIVFTGLNPLDEKFRQTSIKIIKPFLESLKGDEC